MGPIKPWTEWKFATNKAKEHSFTHSANFVMDAYQLGYKFSTDKGGKITSAYHAMSMATDSANFYFRGDCLTRFMGLGCTFKETAFGLEGQHAVELQADLKNKAPGLFGQPLFLRYGMTAPIGPGFDLHWKVLGGKDWLEEYKANFKVND